MSRKIFRREQAKRDIIELALYIAQDDAACAERFIVAAEHAFYFLADTPGAGSRRDYFGGALPGLRMWRIQGFEKHLIFYGDMGTAIEIIRVLHAARDIQALFGEEVTEDELEQLD